MLTTLTDEALINKTLQKIKCAWFHLFYYNLYINSVSGRNSMNNYDTWEIKKKT